MFQKSLLYLSFLVLIATQGCSVHKIVVSEGAAWIGRELNSTEGLQKHDFGFALYDPKSSEWIYRRKADKYFTPASNTKILTLYTALHYLTDSTEALRYTHQGDIRTVDTLIFWGTGDPSLLYRDWGSEHVLDFLRSHEGPILYAPREEIDKYGTGWAWDDYPYRFQVEKSTLPVYGNRVTFSKLSIALDSETSPEYFRPFVIEDPGQDVFAERLPNSNSFEINPALIDEVPFEKEIPFVWSSYDVASILTDVLGRKVVLDYKFNDGEKYKAIKGMPLDTLYQRMMQASDNFIAEQLLLLCANEMNGEYSTEYVIEAAQDSLFSNVFDQFQWFDGSGLSRYNLFTPRSLVWVLDKLLEEKGFDYIRKIFAVGGVSGTIEDWYAGPHGPYVFAKTGTMRNRHCLSGYLFTKSGRTLIFSFMNQNYIGSSAEVKEGMQRILMSIYEKY
jgi:serine-type D-Ala-D-Ala carboxypeptidase/endopeptidase (penicillin-binding protein 4)